MAATEDTATSVVSKETSDNAKQGNISPRAQMNRANSTNKNQVRHRASVACVSCRDRRIKCVVPDGEKECNQCRRTGIECIIKNDDERRRPISKAYMSSLSDRIAMLEGLLLEKGVNPPPAAHPPKTRHEQKQTQEELVQKSTAGSQHQTSPSGGVPSPPDSRTEDLNSTSFGELDPLQEAMMSSHNASQTQLPFQPLPKEDSPFRMLNAKQEDIVHRLLTTKGNLSFDQLSGRLRFFGPTANSHVYAESPNQLDSREPPEQVRRAERIIRSLTTSTHDYLMNHFWEYYNSVIRIIDREAFEADRDSQNPKFYSSFLHITILAMGYRGADMERDDMRKISLGNRESTLHREAKYMLDIELERPGGIPSVQALLLLGDLECGVGRDNTAWMISGMANRLAFDIGLHLDCRMNGGLPDQEVQIRHMVMRACTIYDKYWALFLGRPTSIKSQDIGMDLLQNAFSQLNSGLPDSQTSPSEKDVTGEIYEQLIELMDLAGRIVETRDHHVMNKQKLNNADRNNVFAMSEAEDNAYLHVVNLDRQLQNWYRRLPDHLAWKPSNVKTAPYSYFLLHQQYHVSMILLHRPWAKYGSITGDGASTGGSHPSPEAGTGGITSDIGAQHQGVETAAADHSMGMGDPHSMVHDSRTSLSRSICTQQAIRVARIFWQHRQRFDGRTIFVTGMQHAGTAAIALIAALAYQRSDADRKTYLGYLEILSDAVNDMSHTYHPAARMDDLLKVVLAQIRASLGEPPRSHSRLPYGAMSSSAGRNAFSGSSEMTAPVIPSRREGPDRETIHPNKRRRPGNSRRASEYTRPPPPFFSGLQPTPPNSGGPGGFISEMQNHTRHNSIAEPPLMFPIGSSDNAHMNLDFLNGSAIDMDNMTGDSPMDMNTAAQWGLSNLQAEQQQQHNIATHQFEPSSLGVEWNSGPAGLSASGALGQTHSAAITSGLMSSNGALGATPRTANTDAEGEDSRGFMDAVSPGGLSSLMQSVEKEGGGEATRNHELDFFSFS